MTNDKLRRLIRETLMRQLSEADESPEKKKGEDENPTSPKVPSDKSPADLAHELGLEYQGWGVYVDKSGRPAAKTVDGKLVRIEDEPYGAQPEAPLQQPDASKLSDDPYADSAAPVLGHKNGKVGKIKPSELTGQPGKGKPPLDKNKNPIEAMVDGKAGYIDAVKDGKVSITFHSGESVVVPKSKVKPVTATPKSTKPKKVTSKAELNADELDPKTEKEANKIFKAGGYDPYKPAGETGIKPGWNRGMDSHDVPFDYNGEATVQKLLDLIGDPARVLRWLLKKYQTETANGKSRIRQYIGILKDMGVFNGEGGDEDLVLPA